MPDPIDALVQDWKANPSASKTIALCDALRGRPLGPLVQQVGDFATQRLGDDAAVLLSVARMYVDVQRYAEAQQVLVSAGKVAPRDAAVYKLLGEVLLRRGDASRAEKVLQRAIQLGAHDEDTSLWLEHAIGFKPLQTGGGTKAVAAELAKKRPPPGTPRELLDSMNEITTGVIQRPDKKPRSHGADAAASPMAPEVARGATPVLLRSPTQPRFDPNDETAPGDADLVRRHLQGRRSDAADDAPDATEMGHRPRFDSDDEETQIGESPIQSPGPQAWVPEPSPAKAFARPAIEPAAAPAPAPTLATRLAPKAGQKPPPKPGEKTAVPHPRDVLDALELSGLYEPQAGGSVAWDAAAKGPKRKGAPLIIAGMVLFLGASAGTYYYYRDHRAKDHIVAEAVLASVESQLSAAKVDTLQDIERQMGHALQLETRSQRGALDWARDRVLTGLIKGGEDVGFEDSITRAKDVGVAEDKFAFARVASFLYQGDTAGAAGVMSKWDTAAGGDPWFQLIAGATLDRAGDPRARDRYATASKLAPEMFPAQIAIARAVAIGGDPAEAMRLAKAMRTSAPDRAEGIALVALAWSRDPRRAETPAPPEADDVAKRADELPLGLKAVPHAIAALRAIDKRAGDDARAELQKGLAVSDSPGVAVWIGSIALELGDEALTRKAALTALAMSAAYGPARSLAARVALLGGRLDEALKATEELDASSADAAIVHATVAYERVDVDGIARALDAMGPDGRKLPLMASLALGPDLVSGRSHIEGARVLSLATSEAPWSDLVAMDAALDDGDMLTADKIATSWGRDGESKPLKAMRLARLARYEGRLEAADALSQAAMVGTVTPRVLWERAFTLVARGHSADVGPLVGRYPLVLGPVGTWLAAFATAAGGQADAAKGRVASVDPPPSGAALGMRVVAAAAFGAMKDRRRGADYVRDVLSTGSGNPDLIQAAIALGFHKVEHGKKQRPTYE
jgi:predicted Zn-dependent protease